MSEELHPAVVEYLREFDRSARGLKSSRRAELRDEVRDHLADAIPPDASAHVAALAIADFGTPAEVIGQEAKASDVPSRWPIHKRLIYGFAALLVVALVAGGLVWHFASGSTQESFVNAHSAGAQRVRTGSAYFEYRSAITAMIYPLPKGAAYPVGVPAQLLSEGYGNDGDVVAGGGAVVAHATWLCAWENEYLTALSMNDAARIATAERMIERWTEQTPLLDTQEDPTAWTSLVVDPMKHGDPSGVLSDRSDSCRAAYITVPASASQG